MAAKRKSANPRKPRRGVATASAKNVGDVPELTRAEQRELDRRIKDLDDRTRYLLLSSIGSRVHIYYNIAEDTFSWDEPKHATLFKRKTAAASIRALLGSELEIAECRVDKRGQLLNRSIKLAAKTRRRRK
jgi:hypothetical protein